jgi:putative sterol carrier protein
MSETTNTPQENVQETVQENVQSFNPFSDNAWSATPDFSENPITEQAATTSQDTQEEYEEEIVDADEWLKGQFGWENADAARAEIEELRQLRETASSQAEIEFANEQSAKFFKLMQEGKEDDLYSFLENKKKFDRLTSITELDTRSAAEIIKLNMQQKYKDLTPNEIEYKFNKQFAVPQRPAQGDLETDEEYKEKLSNWEARVKDVETEMFIEAKLAKPELEKFKNELVLPDVQFENGQQQSYEPTQEELEGQIALMDQFKESAIAALSSFDGFNVSVKDEEVEIPLSYSVSDEEKSAVASQIERFADANFDANVVLAERWLKDDGNGGYKLNTNQIIRDLTLLQSEGKVNQKFVNDAASKRLAEYIKKTSNVSVSSQTAQSTFSGGNNKSELDRQIEYIWKNS